MIVLTKENFNRIFYKTTGILSFDNPYEYEGDERKRIKRRALWYISSMFEEQSREKMGFFFPENGTLTGAANQLLTDDDIYGKILLETEQSEYILSEDGEYLEL